MAAAATSIIVNRSWADIVKGDSIASGEQLQETRAVQPAARGERRCPCQGEILVMLGHYGWIMALDEIDHPDAAKTGGRIYVHKRDVMDGVSLRQGDRVSFYLYADDQGLGAEACELDQSALPTLNAEACEFVPVLKSSPELAWNKGAQEFVPAATGFNSEAAEFVPSVVSTMNGDVKEFVPVSQCSNLTAQNMFAINLAFFSDDSDDDTSTVSNDDFSGIDGDREGDSSDNESLHSVGLRPCTPDKAVTWSSGLATAATQSLSKLQGEESDESTSVGSTSASEEEDSKPWANLTTRLAKKLHAKPEPVIMAAHGITLIPGFPPPPGLSLPGVEA